MALLEGSGGRRTATTTPRAPVPTHLNQQLRIPLVAPVAQAGPYPVPGVPPVAPTPVDSRTVTAYRATKAGSVQRRQLVDRLFDQGVIKGDKTYWYGDVGEPDMADLNKAADLMGDNPYRFLDTKEIGSALAALSAGYGTQRKALENQGRDTRRAFQLLSERFAQEKTEGLRGLKTEASGRGILRSGLALQALARFSSDIAKQRSAAVSERDARLRQITDAMAAARTQERAERAELARRLAREQIGPLGDIGRALELV